MRSSAIALLLLGSLAVAMAGGGGGDDPTGGLPGVEDLTPDNFDKLINGGKHALVEFYAPWCGHCKRMVPELKKLGELVNSDPKLKGRVVVAKVNADNHRSLGERYDVKGFPTIKFFGRGKQPSKDTAEDYNGGRTAEAFVEFLKKQIDADKGFARVEALDAVVKGFQDAKDKKSVLDKVKSKVEGLKGDDKVNGDVYVKVAEKAIEKGDEYLAKEKARVEKMLTSGSVHASKVEELSKKVSVIGAFLGDE